MPLGGHAQYKPYWVITGGQRASLMLGRTYSTSTFILCCSVQTQVVRLPQTSTENQMRGDVFRGFCSPPRQASMCCSFLFLPPPMWLHHYTFLLLGGRKRLFSNSFLTSLSHQKELFFFQPWCTRHLDGTTSVTYYYKADHYRFSISGSESLWIIESKMDVNTLSSIFLRSGVREMHQLVR